MDKAVHCSLEANRNGYLMYLLLTANVDVQLDELKKAKLRVSLLRPAVFIPPPAPPPSHLCSCASTKHISVRDEAQVFLVESSTCNTRELCPRASHLFRNLLLLPSGGRIKANIFTLSYTVEKINKEEDVELFGRVVDIFHI